MGCKVMMILGLCGAAGSGKDTIANYLVSHYGFQKLAFASSLKDSIASIFNWDRELLEGSTEKSRLWRETVDEWWATKLDIPHLTPRWVLQQVGTDVMRNHFHSNIWITSLEHKLINAGTDIVVTDIRFENELQIILDHGGHILHISRPTNESSISSNHISEKLDFAEKYNPHRLINDSTIQDLYSRIDALLQTFR